MKRTEKKIGNEENRKEENGIGEGEKKKKRKRKKREIKK